MGEQDPSYHPAVEKIMETDGPNIGRVKDLDVAQSLAKDEDTARYGHGTERSYLYNTNEESKIEVKGEAFRNPEKYTQSGELRDVDTDAIGDSYDKLQRDAERVHKYNEAVRTKKLDDARNKVTELGNEKLSA